MQQQVRALVVLVSSAIHWQSSIAQGTACEDLWLESTNLESVGSWDRVHGMGRSGDLLITSSPQLALCVYQSTGSELAQVGSNALLHPRVIVETPHRTLVIDAGSSVRELDLSTVSAPLLVGPELDLDLSGIYESVVVGSVVFTSGSEQHGCGSAKAGCPPPLVRYFTDLPEALPSSYETWEIPFDDLCSAAGHLVVADGNRLDFYEPADVAASTGHAKTTTLLLDFEAKLIHGTQTQLLVAGPSGQLEFYDVADPAQATRIAAAQLEGDIRAATHENGLWYVAVHGVGVQRIQLGEQGAVQTLAIWRIPWDVDHMEPLDGSMIVGDYFRGHIVQHARQWRPGIPEQWNWPVAEFSHTPQVILPELGFVYGATSGAELGVYEMEPGGDVQLLATIASNLTGPRIEKLSTQHLLVSSAAKKTSFELYSLDDPQQPQLLDAIELGDASYVGGSGDRRIVATDSSLSLYDLGAGSFGALLGSLELVHGVRSRSILVDDVLLADDNNGEYTAVATDGFQNLRIVGRAAWPHPYPYEYPYEFWWQPLGRGEVAVEPYYSGAGFDIYVLQETGQLEYSKSLQLTGSNAMRLRPLGDTIFFSTLYDLFPQARPVAGGDEYNRHTPIFALRRVGSGAFETVGSVPGANGWQLVSGSWIVSRTPDAWRVVPIPCELRSVAAALAGFDVQDSENARSFRWRWAEPVELSEQRFSETLGSRRRSLPIVADEDGSFLAQATPGLAARYELELWDPERGWLVVRDRSLTGARVPPGSMRVLVERNPGPAPIVLSASGWRSGPARVHAEILDLRGRRVRSLGFRTAELAEWSWDGRDDANVAVSRGSYLVRVWTGEAEQIQKLLLLE